MALIKGGVAGRDVMTLPLINNAERTHSQMLGKLDGLMAGVKFLSLGQVRGGAGNIVYIWVDCQSRLGTTLTMTCSEEVTCAKGDG